MVKTGRRIGRRMADELPLTTMDKTTHTLRWLIPMVQVRNIIPGEQNQSGHLTERRSSFMRVTIPPLPFLKYG